MWRKNFKKWKEENKYPKMDSYSGILTPRDMKNYTGNEKTDITSNEIHMLRSITLNIIDEENDKMYAREIKVNQILNPILIDDNGDTILKIEDVDKLSGVLFGNALIRVNTPENC